MEHPTEEVPWTPLASFVFPDFKALDVLGLQHAKDLVYEETEISGFEIYIVEQWTAERKLSALITSYTGNSQDKIAAVRVVLPADFTNWPLVFKDYYNDLISYARPKKIKEDTLFITDLSSLPSTLNLLPIACGDFRQIWNNFKINYNLKRMRCVGRSALLLNGLFTASSNKFAQLYKIPIKAHSAMTKNLESTDNNNISNLIDENNKISNSAQEKEYSTIYPIIELVTIIQTCLTYFGLFDTKRKDGLLCNYTKRAINEWWILYGKYYLSVTKPKNEATMGPTTVASIISLTLSCYFKLMIVGCISSKEPLDENEFLAAIYGFQKKFGFQNKTERVCLDQYTMEKLFEVSAKESNIDIFNFKTRFKSTFQNIAGKGNFIQLSTDILTSDLDTLIPNLHYGKIAIIWKSSRRTEKDVLSLRKRDFIDVSFYNGQPQQLLQTQKNYWEELQYKDTSSQTIENPFANLHESYLSLNNMPQIKDASRNITHTSNITTSPVQMSLDKTYKDEFFRRNSISSPNLALSNDLKEENRMHRSNSISKISDVIETWPLPFDPSPVKIARNVLKINELMRHEQARKAEDDILNLRINGKQTNCDFDKAYFKNSINAMQKKKTLYAKNFQIFNDLFERVENKNLLVQHDLKELDSLSSQLQYNLRVLTRRVRDVEVSIGRFDKEINDIKSKLTSAENKMVDDLDHFNTINAINEYAKQMVNAEETKYEGLFIKLIKTNFLYDIKMDIKKWFLWAFEGIIYSKGIRSTTKVD